MDSLGERVAGRLAERPAGGPAGVVPERACGGEVLGSDLSLCVEQRVEEREPDDVRFGAGGELPGRPVLRLGQLWVELPPQLARVSGERDLAGGLRVLEGAGQVAAEAGAFERVGVAALWEQSDAADGREDESVAMRGCPTFCVWAGSLVVLGRLLGQSVAEVDFQAAERPGPVVGLLPA